MKDIPPAVHWHEGMLLSQQHFQLASRRHEALAQYHASLVSPFHWGVTNLKKELRDGVLSIAEIEAVLPDGLVVTEATDLSIDLKKKVESGASEATVVVKAPARKPGQRFLQRYAFVDDQILDENTGKDDLPVTLLQPKLQLDVLSWFPEDHVGFPIAKVSAQGGGIRELDYEPPLLRVGSGTKIHKVCRDVAGQLREKAASLAARSARASSAAHGLELLETRMLIHSLVSGLPALQLLLDSNCAHPFDLYLALASIYGNLAPGTAARRVDAYDHNDALRLFDGLKSAIETTIDSAVHAPWSIYPFAVEDGRFRLRIEPSWARRPMMLGVRTGRGAKEKEVDAWVEQSTIGAASKIDDLRERRVIGWKRKAAALELPPSSGVTLYELQPPTDEILVMPVDLVVASNDEDRRPAEVLLYVDTEA